MDGHGCACTSEEDTARMSVSMFTHVCLVAQTPHETLQCDPTMPLHILQALERHCAAEGVWRHIHCTPGVVGHTLRQFLNTSKDFF